MHTYVSKYFGDSFEKSKYWPSEKHSFLCEINNVY